MLYGQLITAMTTNESENKGSKVHAIRAKSIILGNRVDQLEVLFKQVMYLMSAIEGQNFKPNNGGAKFSSQ